jgi:hypothetical protein
VGDPVVLGEGDLLNHLPGDGLEAEQGQQDLSKPVQRMVFLNLQLHKKKNFSYEYFKATCRE